MWILWVFETDVSLFRKACLLYKRSKIVFHYLFSRSMTWEYRGLQGVTRGERGYKRLQGVTGGYKGWQGDTRGYQGWQGLQGVTKDYRNFFLTRTFPDTFSCFILYKNSNLKKSQILDQNDGLTPLEKF